MCESARFVWEYNKASFLILLAVGSVLGPALMLFLGAPPLAALAMCGAVIVLVLGSWTLNSRILVMEKSPDPLPTTINHHTDRLRIRRVVQSDLHAVMASIDEEFMYMNGWWPSSLRALKRSHSLKSDVGRRGRLCACKKTTGDPVVFLDLYPARNGPGAWHLGVHTTPEHRGEGFATEALKGVLELIHDAGIGRVDIGTKTDNHSMRHVNRSAGGVEQETTGHRLPNGRIEQVVWYQHTATPAQNPPPPTAARRITPQPGEDH